MDMKSLSKKLQTVKPREGIMQSLLMPATIGWPQLSVAEEPLPITWQAVTEIAF
jgi:hypothetical protein